MTYMKKKKKAAPDVQVSAAADRLISSREHQPVWCDSGTQRQRRLRLSAEAFCVKETLVFSSSGMKANLSCRPGLFIFTRAFFSISTVTWAGRAVDTAWPYIRERARGGGSLHQPPRANGGQQKHNTTTTDFSL